MDLVLLGPTASGKSSVAIVLAEKLRGCVVSVDSRTVYRDFEIGVAKPSIEDLSRVKHFNISELQPLIQDSPLAFETRVSGWRNQHSYPAWIFCGGATLYLQQVLFGSDILPERSPDFQDRFNHLVAGRGKEQILVWLKSVDPEYAQRVDGFNKARISRALDVWLETGRPFSSFHTKQHTKPQIEQVFGLHWPMEELAVRIKLRVETMFSNGLADEFHRLRSKWPEDAPAFNSVGYREFVTGTRAGLTVDEIKALIIKNSIAYAKRQRTWFKRWTFIQWIDASGRTPDELSDVIREKIGYL